MSADRTAWPGAVTDTLRFRVTALATLAVLLVLTAAGVGLVLAQRALLTENLDDALAQEAERVTTRLRAGEAVRATELPSDDVSVAVVASDGTVLAESGQPADADGAGVRRLSQEVDGTTVEVTGSLEDVQESTATLIAALLVAVPLSAAVLAAVVWWSVGRTLRPVEAVRAEVERISGSQLERRVPEPATRDEVARLARTMNAMLGRLDESSRRQRRFVADASHELRSPLARIRSELEVDAAHPESADLAATHSSVLEETVMLQHLADDLLLLARSDAGAAPDRWPAATVDLDEVVTRAAGRFPAVGSVGVDTSAVQPEQVLGDASQLGRAVGNLLDNAARHARSAVVVTLADADGHAVLTVTDDGDGIPAEEAERVFERFTRLDDARHAAHGGAGLGLAIARDIAVRHGGTLALDVEHRPGARFVLSLPLVPPG